MSETYEQEAKVITDLITDEQPEGDFRIEKSFHRFPREAFDLLDLVHPTGDYSQVCGGTFYFSVKYYGVEFTWFCKENFEGYGSPFANHSQIESYAIISGEE